LLGWYVREEARAMSERHTEGEQQQKETRRQKGRECRRNTKRERDIE
jgi:hypothetical protein